MQTLNSVIGSYLEKNGLAKGVAQYNALNVWDNVVGKTVADNTTPESVEHGVLVVRTTTPVWRQELQFQKSFIIENLNKHIGKGIIKDIRFI